MSPPATRMFVEAAQAGAAVAHQLLANATALAALAARLRADPPSAVITCARGSSDHAATYAKYLIETRLGVLVSSASPSVSSIYGAEQQIAGALCLAISQSGRSPDLLATVDAARRAGALTVALVNDAGSPLAAAAEIMLPLHAGAETSVAATKSYIASLAAIAGLVAGWCGDDALDRELAALPAALDRAWELDWSALAEGLRDARGLYVVGRGVGLGIAQEAALKLKEVGGLHAEALSAAEVLHGPMALVGPEMPLLVFRQGDASDESLRALAIQAERRGAAVFLAGTPELPVLESHSDLAPILQIESFYRAAEMLSRARGFDPDLPPHLTKITETV